MNMLTDFIKYPFTAVTGTGGLYFIIWMGIAFLVAYVLCSYGILPALPRIGKKKAEASEE